MSIIAVPALPQDPAEYPPTPSMPTASTSPQAAPIDEVCRILARVLVRVQTAQTVGSLPAAGGAA